MRRSFAGSVTSYTLPTIDVPDFSRDPVPQQVNPGFQQRQISTAQPTASSSYTAPLGHRIPQGGPSIAYRQVAHSSLGPSGHRGSRGGPSSAGRRRPDNRPGHSPNSPLIVSTEETPPPDGTSSIMIRSIIPGSGYLQPPVVQPSTSAAATGWRHPLLQIGPPTAPGHRRDAQIERIHIPPIVLPPGSAHAQSLLPPIVPAEEATSTALSRRAVAPSDLLDPSTALPNRRDTTAGYSFDLPAVMPSMHTTAQDGPSNHEQRETQSPRGQSVSSNPEEESLVGDLGRSNLPTPLLRWAGLPSQSGSSIPPELRTRSPTDIQQSTSESPILSSPLPDDSSDLEDEPQDELDDNQADAVA